MKSSWPIWFGLVAVTVAAFVYDAHNAATTESGRPSAEMTALATR